MAYKCTCGFEIGRLAFMEKINVKAVHNLNELSINVLQGLIVGLQRIHQAWAAIQYFLGHDRTTDPF